MSGKKRMLLHGQVALQREILIKCSSINRHSQRSGLENEWVRECLSRGDAALALFFSLASECSMLSVVGVPWYTAALLSPALPAIAQPLSWALTSLVHVQSLHHGMPLGSSLHVPLQHVLLQYRSKACGCA